MRVVAVAALFLLAGCAEGPSLDEASEAQVSPEDPPLPVVEGAPGTVPDDPAYRIQSSDHLLYIECQLSIIGMGPYCNGYDDYTATVQVPDEALVAQFRWSTNYTDGLQTFLTLDLQDGGIEGGYYKNFEDTHELVVDMENVTQVRVGIRAKDIGLLESFATGIALEAYGAVNATFYLDGVPEGLDPMCIPCAVEP